MKSAFKQTGSSFTAGSVEQFQLELAMPAFQFLLRQNEKTVEIIRAEIWMCLYRKTERIYFNFGIYLLRKWYYTSYNSFTNRFAFIAEGIQYIITRRHLPIV
jgi:hypothetical protein